MGNRYGQQKLNRTNFGSGITPSRTIPFTVIRDATSKINETLNTRPNIRHSLMRVRGMFNGSR